MLLCSVGFACGSTPTQEDDGSTTEEGSGSGESGEDDAGALQGCAAFDEFESVNGFVMSSITESHTGFLGFCHPDEDAHSDAANCCSNDPTAPFGAPLFSGVENDRSHFGQCVSKQRPCLTACDPSASTAEKEAICGPSATNLCCQDLDTAKLDCVFDPGLGCFRQGQTSDIAAVVDDCPTDQLAQALSAAGEDTQLARCSVNVWGEFETAQDPHGQECTELWQQGGPDESSCLDARTLAHQRGMCLTKTPDIMICPLDLSDDQKLANGLPLDGCSELNRVLEYSCG